jgi:hypothetical protein
MEKRIIKGFWKCSITPSGVTDIQINRPIREFNPMYHTIEYTRRKERSWFSGTFLECEREKKKREDMGFEVKYESGNVDKNSVKSTVNTGKSENKNVNL